MSKRRQKASDVFFGKVHPFAGEPTSDFTKAFPSIEDLHLEVVTAFNSIGEGGESRAVYTRANCGEFIDCTNPRCYGGGVRLGTVLRSMADQRETERHWTEPCEGYEGSPKGRKNQGPCDNFFELTLTIQYRPHEGSGEPPKEA